MWGGGGEIETGRSKGREKGEPRYNIYIYTCILTNLREGLSSHIYSPSSLKNLVHWKQEIGREMEGERGQGGGGGRKRRGER